MKHKKRIVLIALCLLAVFVFCACSEQSEQTKQTEQTPGILHAYTEAIKEDIPNDLTLTIYYDYVNAESIASVRLEEFLDRSIWDIKKIVANDKALRLNLPVLRELDDSVLKPITDETYELYEDVCVYYVFERNGEKILDVIINRFYSDVIVNGVYVEYDDIFVDIIAPYAPVPRKADAPWI